MPETKPPSGATLLAGPALFALLLAMPAPQGFSPAAWQVAALTLWMGTWWLTEAVPLPVTALLPLVVLPMLGVTALEPVTAQFAHPIVWLFFGGFALSLAIEKHGLHQRLVEAVLRVSGHGPRAALGGVMLATAALSMWVNNTSAALAMLPAGRALINRWPAHGNGDPSGDDTGAPRFSRAVLLGIAYAATMGGLGTLVGTAPNAFLAAFLQDRYGIDIGFARWMLIGVPLATMLLLASWWLLARQYRLPAHQPSLEVSVKPSAWSPSERRLALVFGLVVAAWLLRPLAPWAWAQRLGDTGVAMTGALVLFLLPAGTAARGECRTLLEWHDVERMPWGVLVLFGGGLALADAVSTSGLAQALGGLLAPLTDGPPWLILAAVVASMILISEFASNVAVAAAFLPVVGAIASGGDSSIVALIIPAGLAASCAFMMPVGTPPNALAFSQGVLRVRDMARAGLYLNLLSWLLLAFALPWLLQALF